MRASGSALRHGQARAAPAQARQPAQLPGVQMWQRWAARPRPPPPLAGWLGPPPVQGCCLPAPLATGRALLCARLISMTAHVAHRSNMSALAIAEPRAKGRILCLACKLLRSTSGRRDTRGAPSSTLSAGRRRGARCRCAPPPAAALRPAPQPLRRMPAEAPRQQGRQRCPPQPRPRPQAQRLLPALPLDTDRAPHSAAGQRQARPTQARLRSVARAQGRWHARLPPAAPGSTHVSPAGAGQARAASQPAWPRSRPPRDSPSLRARRRRPGTQAAAPAPHPGRQARARRAAHPVPRAAARACPAGCPPPVPRTRRWSRPCARA